VDLEFTQIEDVVSSGQQTETETPERFCLKDYLLSLTGLFCSPRVLKPLILSLALMFFQQASGVNAVIFYTSQIFASAGFSSNPNIPTMIVGAVLVVATFVSCLVADVAGRRILLLISGTGMTVSIAILGIYFYVSDIHQVPLSVCLSVCLSVSVKSLIFGVAVVLTHHCSM